MAANPVTEPSAPLIGWRLLALFYDLWPVAAIWMAIAAAFLVAHGNRPLAPFSAMQWLLWIACWVATGAYAVISWRRGGQTLGMRPWRIRVVGQDGNAASLKALLVRFSMGSLALLLGGAGFWWAWIDRERLTWHDRASGTRMIREPKRAPL